MKQRFDKRKIIKSIIKPLVWHEYNLKHDYGYGSLETYSYIGGYEILYCYDENNLRYYFCKSILTNFKDLEKAKEAYEDYYISCVCSLIDNDKLKELWNGEIKNEP